MLGIKSKLDRMSRVLRGIWRYNVTTHLGVLLPEEMIINLTYWCDSRCIMCNIWKRRPKSEMGLEEWKKVIDDPIFARVRSLTISGGEPTMHVEFEKIVELFVTSLPRLKNLSLITNGFMVSRVVTSVERVAIICKRNNVNLGVSVSLDGVEGVHEKVRRIPDGFKKTTSTILKLKKLQEKYHFGLGSGSLILRQNIDRLEELEQWYQKYNIDHSYQIVGFHDTFVENLDTQKGVDYRKREKNQLITLMEEFSRPKSLFDVRSYYWRDMLEMYRDGKERRSPCPFRVDQMVLDSFGDVYYCLSVVPIGNFIKEKRTILAIYRDLKNIEKRKNMWQGACKNCNSGCNVNVAIANDFWKYFRYRLTGRI